MDENTRDLIALSLVSDLGAIRFKHLLDYFGSPRAILEADEDELRNVGGIGGKIASEISSLNSKPRLIQEELKKIERSKVSVISIFDKDYPVNLKSIYDPPFILYIKGKIIPEDVSAVAIVGTRRLSEYGKAATEKIVKGLIARKATIVSGMARGIDTVAHRTALSCGGRTIAVLGSGINVCYPPENRRLFEQIAQEGAVISEFPMSTAPERYNFPVRNRVISGLSLGVVVIEAGRKSGALITADMALEQGREVFAVPGSIFSDGARGSHSLIRQGAKLVESCEDVIDEIDLLKEGMLPLKGRENNETDPVDLSDEEERVYSLLSYDPLQIDSISEMTDFPINRISFILVNLEMKGRIREIPGKMFVRT